MSSDNVNDNGVKLTEPKKANFRLAKHGPHAKVAKSNEGRKAENDLFEGYHNMLSIEEDMMMGIMEEGYRKFRSKSKTVSQDAAKVMHCDAYDSKFCIPLTHPILVEHGAFYQKALTDHLEFQIKLAGADYITITSDSSKDFSFQLKLFNSNTLPFFHHSFSSSALINYQEGRTFLFEDVHLFKTIPDINLKTQKTLAVQIKDS